MDNGNSLVVSRIPFKFRLGELTLGSIGRNLVVDNKTPFHSERDPRALDDQLTSLPTPVDGVLLRSIPTSETVQKLQFKSSELRYVPRQYERYFVDLTVPYEDYMKSFSSKSRSTLRRKARKFAERSGGATDWRSYETADEMKEFYRHAREISAHSYQERLLDAGLPDDDAFRDRMLEAAKSGRVRGYLIFLDAKPLAYLYCPIAQGVVTYSYLGYRPEASDLSPGTVLLWLTLEALFQEQNQRVFDFTEGGDHSKHSQKRLFATSSVRCADVYILKRRAGNVTVVLSHAAAELASETIGKLLERVGAKKRIRHWTRRITAALHRGPKED